jgi:transcriptional regulator with GAF, ATPase, and Fis domain
MTSEAAAYLVMRRDDGFGDVFTLSRAQRFTVGRANTNRIVLEDDLCSREHAEVYCGSDGRWVLRDLNSLNGTKINGERIIGEKELSPQDAIHLGRTTLVFVEDMSQLPDMPAISTSDSVTIKKRLAQIRYLTPFPPATPASGQPGDTISPEHTISRDLAQLYRLALEMGSAGSFDDLIRIVLEGLLDNIPADAGAILMDRGGEELELIEYRNRASTPPTSYVKVSQFLTREVLTSREAVLAEDVSSIPSLQNRKSIQVVGATSLICAPVIFNEAVLGIVHLYSMNPARPLDAEDLEFVLAVARQLGVAIHYQQRQASLAAENRSLRDQLRVESELVGESGGIKDVERQIALVADTNATVLIRGESGTGKELVARALHYSSRRKEGPFICLNCAALPESLLESELFGHEKGAFTGATEKKLGKFEAANRGTIFLDEIGELHLPTQAKLLRVLEGHPFERVGGHIPIRVDVRVVAATNQPIEQAMNAGRFRRDLFFRLQVVEIRVPPLRDRRKDVPLLADYFLRRFVRETGRKLRGFTPEAMKKMEEYSWPGNVRELRNVVERAVALGQGPELDSADIWLSSLESGLSPTAGQASENYEPASLDALEKEHIRRTLEHTDWNKSQAAAILNIERSTLDRKIKLYALRR